MQTARTCVTDHKVLSKRLFDHVMLDVRLKFDRYSDAVFFRCRTEQLRVFHVQSAPALRMAPGATRAAFARSEDLRGKFPD